MSRVQIVGENYELAFGVDHLTGAFVQLWLKPASNQDCSAIKIDSHGVKVEQTQRAHLNEALMRFTDQQEKRFGNWRVSSRAGLPNIDEQVVIDLALYAGGFNVGEITAQVYRIFNT